MITDVNVNLSRWPFRRLPGDRLAGLIEKLRQCNVTQAWAGSFDGLFHKDIDGVNARLADACRQGPPGLLRPFGTINPMLPDWCEDVRRADQQYRMRGIRLHPNYHGYRLDDPALGQLLTEAEQRGLIVQLAVRMEDPRTQHPLMRVADVDVRPLADLVAARPQLRLVLLNALGRLRPEEITRLSGAGQVYFEISMLEGVGGVGRLLGRHGVSRILFGSHFPFFILESAILKLRESELTAGQMQAVTSKNAERLLNRVK